MCVEEVELNTITFNHRDGAMTFEVRWAWFHVSAKNCFSMSIQCAEHLEHSWMSTPCFCLIDFQLSHQLADGMVIRFPGNVDTDEDGPSARVYTGSHDLPRNIEIKFGRLSSVSCDIEVSWVQGDTIYYDDRAQGTPVVGQCRLKRGEMKNIWNPG